jgi:hypothetical protein
VNQRVEHTVGVLLGIFCDAEDFPEEAITGMLLGADAHAQAVAARALAAAAPLYADKAPPTCFQILHEEVSALCVFVRSRSPFFLSVCVCAPRRWPAPAVGQHTHARVWLC